MTATRFRPIERRIIAGVAKACRDGLVPTSIYLTPADRRELLQAAGRPPLKGPVTLLIGGLPLRLTRNLRCRSVIYCRHGIRRQIPARPPP